MGGNNSTPCDSGGTDFCRKVEGARECGSGGGNYYCVCEDGYKSQGINSESSCVDVDECSENPSICMGKGDCSNTPGSYICGCGKYRRAQGGGCVDIDECETNRGDCDKNSDCINNDGSMPTCKCHKGWTGNNDKPGVPCRDVNECDENPSICPTNATCTNLPGSYKCECEPGFESDATGTGCVTADFCGTGKNDCDKNFAVCSLVPGSYKCECMIGFKGNGTAHTCEPLPGNEELACSRMGLSCGSYKMCTRSLTEAGIWECIEKPSSEQISVFLANGMTSETPTWIWGVVGLATLVIILVSGGILWCVYNRFFKKDDAEEELLNVQQAQQAVNPNAFGGGGFNYGATQRMYA